MRRPLTPLMFWGLASAGLIAIGSFGPWASLGIIDRGALDGDGLFTLAIGIAAFALVLFDRVPVVVIVLALVAIAIAEVDGQDITQREVFGVAFQRGWGILMVEAAAGSLALWGLVAAVDGTGRRAGGVERRKPPAA